MINFATKRVPVAPNYSAPDGSDVRLLLRLERGDMAHFELGPGRVTEAVTHGTVEEIWFFLSGRGIMWRKQGDKEEEVSIEPGVCVTIPMGTHFQFRSYGYDPLAAIAVTTNFLWSSCSEEVFSGGSFAAHKAMSARPRLTGYDPSPANAMAIPSRKAGGLVGVAPTPNASVSTCSSVRGLVIIILLSIGEM